MFYFCARGCRDECLAELQDSSGFDTFSGNGVQIDGNFERLKFSDGMPSHRIDRLVKSHKPRFANRSRHGGIFAAVHVLG